MSGTTQARRVQWLRRAGLAVIFSSIVLAPRVFGLGSFVTVDEATWLMRSGNFYYALGQRDFTQTIAAYHPGVTTMWMGVLGTLIEFEGYRGQGQGYFIKEWKHAEFLESHGVDPLEIMETSRLLIGLVNAALILAVTYFLAGMIGSPAAVIVFVLLGFDPYITGHTRIMAHEGMLSLLTAFSLVCALRYLFHGERRMDLALSAAAAALAMLTKSTATLLIPAVALLFIYRSAAAGRLPPGLDSTPGYRVRSTIRGLAIWAAVAGGVYFIAWPAMWASPGAALAEVYRNAFSYALEGHQSGLTVPSLYTDFDLGVSGVERYLDSVFWHTTPTIWVGSILGIAALIAGLGREASGSMRRTLIIFLIFALGFVTFMSLAGGRRSAHYILSAYAALDLVAGLGLALTYRALRTRFPSRRAAVWASAAVGVLLLSHAAAGAAYYPYFFNYANPIMARVFGIEHFETGYGEVLEQAADYLSRKPGAERLTVLAWYGIGPFSYFFPGNTELLAPGEAWTLSQVERLQRSDYLVLYYHHQVNRNMPATLLWRLAGTPYEHAIWRNGIEYVRIYRVADLPVSVRLPDPATPIFP
jgi:4-amino-4-deoxy-L-arabinose transferase-like glycosyltransferase